MEETPGAHFIGAHPTTLIWIIALLACSLPSRADTLYTTFGPAQAFGSGGYTIEDGLGWAAPFQPTATGALGSIDVALSVMSNTAMSAQVILANDAAGSPGSVIESFTVNSLASTPTIETVDSTLNPVLTAGDSYWFEVIGEGSEPGVDIGQLYNNSQGLTETVDITSNNGATWSTFSSGESDPAFDLNTTVPEPASLAVAVGLLTAVFPRRRPRVRA